MNGGVGEATVLRVIAYRWSGCCRFRRVGSGKTIRRRGVSVIRAGIVSGIRGPIWIGGSRVHRVGHRNISVAFQGGAEGWLGALNGHRRKFCAAGRSGGDAIVWWSTGIGSAVTRGRSCRPGPGIGGRLG